MYCQVVDKPTECYVRYFFNTRETVVHIPVSRNRSVTSRYYIVDVVSRKIEKRVMKFVIQLVECIFCMKKLLHFHLKVEINIAILLNVLT